MAIHAEETASSADYHRQYDEGAFLHALRATRTRQAQRILSLLRRHLPDVSHVADFGAGRGFFLAACKDAGLCPLAGLDTSPLAIEGLQANGIEAHLLKEHEAPFIGLRRLSFPPRVIAFLDVIEHFPPGELAARVRGAVAAAGEGFALLVIKVPVPGLLYAGASILSRLGAHGPLRQLYQAGTWPPHFSYFSHTSLRQLLSDCDLTVVQAIGDADFEASTFPDRVGAGGPLARAVTLAAGAALAAVVRHLGWFDSTLVLARPLGRDGATL
jgi:hypothetical protein